MLWLFAIVTFSQQTFDLLSYCSTNGIVTISCSIVVSWLNFTLHLVSYDFIYWLQMCNNFTQTLRLWNLKSVLQFSCAACTVHFDSSVDAKWSLASSPLRTADPAVTTTLLYCTFLWSAHFAYHISHVLLKFDRYKPGGCRWTFCISHFTLVVCTLHNGMVHILPTPFHTFHYDSCTAGGCSCGTGVYILHITFHTGVHISHQYFPHFSIYISLYISLYDSCMAGGCWCGTDGVYILHALFHTGLHISR